jgi:hypothetical protein
LPKNPNVGLACRRGKNPISINMSMLSTRSYLTSLLSFNHAALASFACKNFRTAVSLSRIDCLTFKRFIGFVFQTFDDISVKITFEHNRINVTLSTNCRSISEYFGDRADCIFEVCFGLRFGISGNRFGRLNARSDN